MKALVKTGPHPGLELTDRPEPECGPHDVKIRVHTTGICGTDLHIEAYDAAAQAMITTPLVPGHEFYGEVVEVGSRVDHVKVGQRVSGEGHIVCGMCRNCRAGRRQMCIDVVSVGVQRDGAFAEYVVIPEVDVWLHKDDAVSAELGAVFDPLGNAVHTALMFPLVGEDVLITGAGPIGLMAIGIARHAGARRIAVTAAGDEDGAAREVLNFCANNYLGLADDARLVAAAKDALDARGFGMASVRFICGTQDGHLELERRLADFLGTDDAILFSSCFDANAAVFEPFFGPEDAIVSDALNHASIIDGIRLSKAHRLRYANRDMADLRARLEEAKALNDGAGAGRTIVVTDGVFSMDGYLAPLAEICDLADEYGALVMVDDSHAVGFMGATGAGTPEHAGVADRVDVYTGTFGKALGGASGGYVAARQEIVDVLRQRGRPYLFSNSLAPAIVAATLTALDILETSAEPRRVLFENAALFRRRMGEEGFELLPGEHAIIPVRFGDAVVAARIAHAMLDEGVFVTAFSYPVVPRDAARIRVQLSAAHSSEDVEAAVQAFVRARRTVLG